MFFYLPVTSFQVLARAWFHVITDLFCKISVLTNAELLVESVCWIAYIFTLHVCTDQSLWLLMAWWLWILVHGWSSTWVVLVISFDSTMCFPFVYPNPLFLSYNSVLILLLYTTVMFLGVCFSGSLENSWKDFLVQIFLSLHHHLFK